MIHTTCAITLDLDLQGYLDNNEQLQLDIFGPRDLAERLTWQGGAGAFRVQRQSFTLDELISARSAVRHELTTQLTALGWSSYRIAKALELSSTAILAWQRADRKEQEA